MQFMTHTSSVASVAIDIWVYTPTWMVKKRCHASVRKSIQFGSEIEKSIYKCLGDTVEKHIVTGGDDQSNVENFFENSEDNIKYTLDDALKMNVYV